MTSTPPTAAPSRLVIDAVTVLAGPEPRIRFEGATNDGIPDFVTLRGTRQTLTAELTVNGDRWQAVVPLLVSTWHGPLLPPRSGRYTLSAGVHPVTVTAELPSQQLLPSITRVAFSSKETGLEVTFSAPLSDRERGRLQQASLEADYRSASYEPIDAVFFESFFGRNASDNPRAIDRALAKLRPDIARYWSIADASIEVPEGGIALIEGSAEWWRIRGSARLLVVNDWLRKRLRKRKYQKVLQTWHGTMLKKLALSRTRQGLRPALATLRERARWDILLAQNPHSKRVFRRAYAYLGPVWEEGYPRDDLLVNGDPAAVRTRLGIADDATVLLYAPTWRDDRPDHVDHLDVPRFARELGDGYVTLIRGHSRTLLPGEDVYARNVLDVTAYPDVAELFLVADALITDYSSVMFDFTVTGKPLFFFTPDLDHYRENLRGFYFDLIPVAPGPVVSKLEDLVELVKGRDEIRPRYAEKYGAWRARFNPRDDGNAAERVVQRLLNERIIG